jgi:hypothetical protein
MNGLTKTLKFAQSKVDKCVFYRCTTILLIYVDDGILCGPRASKIKTIIAKLHALFDVTNEGDIDDAYLGVKIVRSSPSDLIELMQPHLIQHILLDDIGMKPNNSKMQDTAALSSTILHRDLDGEPFAEK